jgi:hypothetical protein
MIEHAFLHYFSGKFFEKKFKNFYHETHEKTRKGGNIEVTDAGHFPQVYDYYAFE